MVVNVISLFNMIQAHSLLDKFLTYIIKSFTYSQVSDCIVNFYRSLKYIMFMFKYFTTTMIIDN